MMDLDSQLSAALQFMEKSGLDLSNVSRLDSVIRLKRLAASSASSSSASSSTCATEKHFSSANTTRTTTTTAQNLAKQIIPFLKRKGWVTLLVASLLLAIGFGLKKETIGAALGYFMGHSNPRDQCIIPVPSSWKDKVRPPVNCAICQDVTSVERVSGLNPEDFFSEYVEKGRPAVVTDGMKNWTAQLHFSYEFFHALYTEDDNRYMDNFEEAGCQFFPYKTEFKSLREVFEMDEDRAAMQDGYRPWYVGWGSCDVEVNEGLRKFYQRPYFLPQTSEGTKMDWIFMGTPGFGAHMHVDHVRHPSWQAQIKGQKLWSLQPPPECYFKCVDMEVTVQPGEIIVLDTNRWYHSTLVASDDVSITIGSEFD